MAPVLRALFTVHSVRSPARLVTLCQQGALQSDDDACVRLAIAPKGFGVCHSQLVLVCWRNIPSIYFYSDIFRYFIDFVPDNKQLYICTWYVTLFSRARNWETGKNMPGGDLFGIWVSCKLSIIFIMFITSCESFQIQNSSISTCFYRFRRACQFRKWWICNFKGILNVRKDKPKNYVTPLWGVQFKKKKYHCKAQDLYFHNQ